MPKVLIDIPAPLYRQLQRHPIRQTAKTTAEAVRACIRAALQSNRGGGGQAQGRKKRSKGVGNA